MTRMKGEYSIFEMVWLSGVHFVEDLCWLVYNWENDGLVRAIRGGGYSLDRMLGDIKSTKSDDVAE